MLFPSRMDNTCLRPNGVMKLKRKKGLVKPYSKAYSQTTDKESTKGSSKASSKASSKGSTKASGKASGKASYKLSSDQNYCYSDEVTSGPNVMFVIQYCMWHLL